MLRSSRIAAAVGGILGVLSTGTAPVAAWTSFTVKEARRASPHRPASPASGVTVEWVGREGTSLTELPDAQQVDGAPISLDEHVTRLRTRLGLMEKNIAAKRHVKKLVQLHEVADALKSGSARQRNAAVRSLGVTVVHHHSPGRTVSTFSLDGEERLRVAGPSLLRQRLPRTVELPDGSGRDEYDDLQAELDAEGQWEGDNGEAYAVAVAVEAQAIADEVETTYGSDSIASCPAVLSGPSSEDSSMSDCWEQAIGAIYTASRTVVDAAVSITNIRGAVTSFKSAISSGDLRYLPYAEFAVVIRAALAALVTTLTAEMALLGISAVATGWFLYEFLSCYYYPTESESGPEAALPRAEGFGDLAWTR